MTTDNAVTDIAFIRLALLDETLCRVEKLPYPGEIQILMKRRISLIRLSELLYSVCGGEELPSFTPEDKPEQKPTAAAINTEHSQQNAKPSAETKAIMEFFGRVGENVVLSAAEQAARTGKVNSDTAKRAAVSGIAQTISLMMREDRNK